MAPSSVEAAEDRLEDLAELAAKIDASTLSDPSPSARLPHSAAASSAGSDWEVVPRKRKGAVSEASSNASRCSSNVLRAAPFLRKPPSAGT